METSASSRKGIRRLITTKIETEKGGKKSVEVLHNRIFSQPRRLLSVGPPAALHKRRWGRPPSTNRELRIYEFGMVIR